MTENTVLPSQICSHLFRVVISAFILSTGGEVEGSIDRDVIALKSIQKFTVSLFTWILPQHRAAQTGCPVS